MSAALCQYAGKCSEASLPLTGLDIAIIIFLGVSLALIALVLKKGPHGS